MKKTLAIVSLLPLAALTLMGCTETQRATTLPPGEYESTTKSVDADGTAREQKSTTNVYYDENGNKKASVYKKNTTDPKGLFNKSTSETYQKVE